MPTLGLCAWLLVTVLAFAVLTYAAITKPTPLYIRVFLGAADLAFMLGWLEAGSILWERLVRRRPGVRETALPPLDNRRRSNH